MNEKKNGNRTGKLYYVLLGFVLFLCVSAETIVTHIL